MKINDKYITNKFRDKVLNCIVSFWTGPKPQTISDFWTMIWQEEICNIVCLTNLKEGPKVQKYLFNSHFQNKWQHEHRIISSRVTNRSFVEFVDTTWRHID